MKRLILCVMLTMGSFALWAQDDVGGAQGNVSNEQVIEEMKIYLTHLNHESVSDSRVAEQLHFLQKIKELWKINEFRKLRSTPLSDLIQSHSDAPYFLCAITFHNEDLEALTNTVSHRADHVLFEKAIQFRERLRSDIQYTFDQAWTANDFSFSEEHPSHLQAIMGHSRFRVIDLESQKLILDRKEEKLQEYYFTHGHPGTILSEKYFAFEIQHREYESTGYNSIGFWDFDTDSLISERTYDPNLILKQHIYMPREDFYVYTTLGSQTHLFSGRFGHHEGRDYAPSSQAPITALDLTSDHQFVSMGQANGDIDIIFADLDGRDYHSGKYWRPEESLPIDLIASDHSKSSKDFLPDFTAYHFKNNDQIHISSHNDTIKTIALTPNELVDIFFSSSGLFFIINQYSIQIWDMGTFKLIQTLHGRSDSGSLPHFPMGSITKALVSPDSQWIAILESEGSLAIYHLSNNQLPDLSLINLVDPDKLSPPVGGGK